MIKKIIFINILLSLLTIPNAFAGSGNGNVEQILVQKPNFVFFSVTNRATIGQPVCALSGSGQFTIDVSTELGEAQYALVLAAKGLGQSLVVTGDDECNDWSDRESINFMFTTD